MTLEIKKKPAADYRTQILYSWNYLEWGGAQVLFFGLMKEAKKHADVTAIIPSGSHPQLIKFLDNLNVPQEFFGPATDIKPANTLRRKIERHWNKLRSEIALVRFLKKRKLENSIIHTELAPFQSMLALLWLCRRMPVFVTMHNRLPQPGALRWRLWKIKFAILARAANFHVFTANRDTKKSLAPLVPKSFLEKIKVVYANVNPEEIDEAVRAKINRSELLEKYRLPDDKFLVFCVGQFIDRKGRWIFLEAAQKLAAEYDDIQFVWISNYQPEAAELEKAESYNLAESFIRFPTASGNLE